MPAAGILGWKRSKYQRPILHNSKSPETPRKSFLEIIKNQGIPVTFSSDSHSAQTIISDFDRAEKAARNAGYSEIMYINEQGQAVSQAL